MLMNFIHFVYILSLVSWVGSIIFFSFFTAPVIFKLLDREKAGKWWVSFFLSIIFWVMCVL